MNLIRYSHWARWLHWAIALLLAFQISLGWRLEDLARGAQRAEIMGLHKSVGILILLLSLWRLGLRLATPRPAPVADAPALMGLTKAIHWGLYVVMIGAPLSGWVISSTSRNPQAFDLFGLVPWPVLPLDRALHEPAEAVHSIMANLLIGLFVLHVLGAVRHQVLKGQDIMGRMIGTAASRARGLGLIIFALVTIGIALALARLWPVPPADPAQSVPAPAATAPRA